MFHDVEAKGKNWHKELPFVLCAIRTNVNRAPRDIPFDLVYGADVCCHQRYFLNQLRLNSSTKKIKVKKGSLTPISCRKSAIKC
jgi:hypothetical protein